MDEVTDQQLEELEEKQLKLDVPISVFKDGEWGTYRSLEDGPDWENKYTTFESIINRKLLKTFRYLPKSKHES